MLPVPFRKSCISNLLLSYFRQKRTDDNQPVWLICLHFRVSSCVFFFLLQLLPAIASWCFLLIKCDVRYLEEWNTDQNPGRVQILNRSLKKKKKSQYSVLETGSSEAQVGKILARRGQQNQMLAVIAVLCLVVIQYFSKLLILWNIHCISLGNIVD